MSMRRLPVLTAFVSLLILPVLSAAARAEEIEADSRLAAVTVYTGRATLTREAEVDIPAGAGTVVFSGLPANLLPDSLRAEGRAGMDVKFGAVASKLVTGAELAAPREKELNARLEALNDQRAAAESEKQALAARQAFLNSLSQQAAARSRENIADFNLKPDDWDGAAQAVYAGISAALKAQLAQDVILRDLDRQIAQVAGELDQIRTGQSSTYRVSLPVEADRAGKLTVALSYQVPDATWTPLYDARLDTETGALDLVQYGSVRQVTGEDWTDVALTLSTAQPQEGAALPPLQTMWIDLMRDYPVPMAAPAGRMTNMQAATLMKAAQAPMMSMEMAADAGAVSAVAEDKAASFVVAQIETGGFVNEYKIPGPSSVKADGTESKLMIGTFKTANRLQVHVKPQVSSKAGLVSRVTLEGEASLLAGPVSLFRDGAFIGQADLPFLRPGEESKLSFGIDDQVSVERHVMKDEKSEAGVIAKDSVLERRFVTDIRNLHTKPVDIVVLETVPVPQDDKIRVEIVKDATSPGYKEDMFGIKGLLGWEKTLEPKQDTKALLGWKVSWPKDQSLNGL